MGRTYRKVGRNRLAYKILGSNPEGKRPFERPRQRNITCYRKGKCYEPVVLIHGHLNSGKLL
jgi:hypothetical protein